MKILRSICTVLPVLLLSSCMQRDALKAAGECYADYVNPFIGTDFTGNTYPGAQVPFGMVQLSPDNGLPGWDRISGYFIPTVRLPVSVTPISRVQGRAICMTFPSCR